MTSGIEVFHAALLGMVSAVFVTGLYWVAVGDTPSGGTLIALSFALGGVVRFVVSRRRQREVDTLRTMFDQPPHERG